MFRHWLSIIVLACLVITPVQAGELQGSGIVFSQPDLKSNLIKNGFLAGGVGIEIFADGQVDAARLFAGIDRSKSASAQAISNRVNEMRKLLYPDEEIILVVTPPQDSRAAAAGEKAALVKAIYLWNNTNCSDCYWFAQYKSTVATMFIDDIEYGAYDIYDQTGNGRWIYRYEVFEGDAASRFSVGARTNRGFMGVAAGVPSRADVVLYFFK